VRLLLVHDAVADEGRADHHLDGGAAAQAVGPRDQALRDGRLQHAGQLQADLLLLVRREDRDDAVDRLGGVQRVQRREDEVARFGRHQRGLDRLEVAHLADQDHVRVLAQRAAQRVGEPGIDRDLALVDDRPVVAVEELDRVLDRHDVGAARVVDVVDHRRQRRALAAAGGPGDQHEAALLVGDPREDRRQAEFVDPPDAEGDHAQDDADRPALLEDVAAEAAEARHAVRQVDLLRFLELLRWAADITEAAIVTVSSCVSRFSSEVRRQQPAHPHHRVAADLEVQVGRPLPRQSSASR
jgi:hypothetical protein